MKYGLIATGSKESLQTAKEILSEGGNAFDAAIAAIFTSMVSEFALTGAGGGGTLLGMTKNSSPIIYDFFVDCPELHNKKIDFKKVNIDFGNTQQEFHIGKGSVAVPGNIAGLLDVHKENGKLPLNLVLEPAIQIAKNGVILSDYQAYINSLIKPILLESEEGKKLFISNNKFLIAGDIFKNPCFADFLFSLSKEGKDLFYNGECAKLIDEHYGNDGFISKKCLQNYQTIKRKPISIKLNEYTIITNPAPSYAGTLMIFLFSILKNTRQLNDNIINLIKIMELTSLARKNTCTNPLDEMEINQLLDKTTIKKYEKIFKNNNYTNYSKLSGFGSTTHISIMDKEENIVSVTTTNGEGSGDFIPGCGIMMNNMLGEQDLNPYGFHKWKSIRRLPTMICPTIILKNNKPIYALGSGGSNRIRSAIIQVIINLLIKKMPLDIAINEPRLHLEGNELYFEEGIKIPKSKKIEHLKLNPFENKHLFFGGVNAVGLDNAVGDQRRGGIGEVF